MSDIDTCGDKVEEFYHIDEDGSTVSSYDKVTVFYDKEGKKLFKFGMAYDNVQLLVKEVKNMKKSKRRMK